MDNRNAVLHANRFAAGIERIDIELRDDDVRQFFTSSQDSPVFSAITSS